MSPEAPEAVESFTRADFDALAATLIDVRDAGYPCPFAEELLRLDRPLQARILLRVHRAEVLETIKAETRRPRPQEPISGPPSL